VTAAEPIQPVNAAGAPPTQVICTAGHVDHGKSALIRALTGTEPDRFEEERRRGLTIDLGFGWLDSPCTADGRTVRLAFVDLPGHSRFIGNMLAGAGPSPACLFVVAADEGWMPQSQEHAEILTLLGIRRAVVAITKADLVDGDTLDLAVELVRAELATTSFADAPIVAASARTGEGLDQLTATLGTLVHVSPDEGRPRLWVDRSFSIRGSGTVVTGTLAGGFLSADDDVVLAPYGRPIRIRGMRSQQETITVAPPGSRVAVNLSGTPAADIVRGDAIVLDGQWTETACFDAELVALPGRSIQRRGAWQLCAGAGEWHAAVAPIDGPPVRAGQPGFARIEIDRAAPLAPGDRFVLRESGRSMTMGGGRVLDVVPGPAVRGRPRRDRRLRELVDLAGALDAGDRARFAAALLSAHGVIPAASLDGAVGRSPSAPLAEAAGARLLARSWVDAATMDTWSATALGAVADYHAAHPFRRAAPADVVATAVAAVGVEMAIAEGVAAVLIERGRLVAESGRLRLPGHRGAVGVPERAEFLRLLDDRPLRPPPLAQAMVEAGIGLDAVHELINGGEVVLIEDDIAMTAATIEGAHQRLRQTYDEEGPLSAARAKQILQTTRKYAMPLLAELDRRGHTRRRGDVREVLP